MPAVNTETYRAAIIGCGGRGRAHMPGLTVEKRLRLVAVADIQKESAERFAADFGPGVTAYADYSEMLARERPDIVVVALWTPLHLSVIHHCAEAGVRAVLSEKPMAARWDECQEIARIAEAHDLLLTFCHQRRFAPGNRKVRELLAAGRIGTIERMDLFSPPHLLDCGTHTVDQALSFHAETPVTWVHGAADLTETVNYFGVPAEGMFTGFLHFADGVHATLRTGRVDMEMGSGVRVVGSDGFIETYWDGDIRRAVIYREPSWTFPEVETIHEGQMIGMVQNAVDCLASGAEPELSFRRALRASEILFALYESARRRERVALPLDGAIAHPLDEMLAAR